MKRTRKAFTATIPISTIMTVLHRHRVQSLLPDRRIMQSVISRHLIRQRIKDLCEALNKEPDRPQGPVAG